MRESNERAASPNKLKRVATALTASVVAACLAFGLVGCGQQASSKTDKWDGTIDTSWYSEDAKDFELNSAEQLAGLAELVNGGATFEGATVKLKINVDLDEREWTPIGGDPSYNGTSFRGNFDGCGNTIVGLHVVSPLSCQAFFGSVAGGTLSNFVIRGSVQGRQSSAGVVADASDECFENIVNDVDVFSTDYYNNVNTAGMIGHFWGGEEGSTLYVRNCTNNGTVNANCWSVAGLIGDAGLAEGVTLEITNCENKGSVTVDAYGKDGDQACAGLVAAMEGFGTFVVDSCKNSAEVSSTDLASVSGVIGSITATNCTLKNCSNSGKISTDTVNEYAVAAGIVANTGSGSYTQTGCTNSGELSAYNGMTFDVSPGGVK